MPGHGSTIYSHYLGKDLFVSSSCVSWKPVVLSSKASPVSWSHWRHRCQLQAVIFRIFFCLCWVWRLRTNLMTLHTFDLPLLSKHTRTCTPLPAVPKPKRRWWQRIVLSLCELGRQVHFILVCPSLQLAFLLWPTILTLSAALTSNMPF